MIEDLCKAIDFTISLYNEICEDSYTKKFVRILIPKE